MGLAWDHVNVVHSVNCPWGWGGVGMGVAVAAGLLVEGVEGVEGVVYVCFLS